MVSILRNERDSIELDRVKNYCSQTLVNTVHHKTFAPDDHQCSGGMGTDNNANLLAIPQQAETTFFFIYILKKKIFYAYKHSSCIA